MPDDDLACLKVTAGKAYIYGYDVDVTTPQIIDFEKPRSFERVENQSFNFEMGNRFLVNNVSGITTLTERIELMGGPIGGSLNAAGTSQKIGDAKVYGFSLRDAAYENNGTDWNLYLYDIQTYTSLELNDNVSSDELNQSGFIVGKESGAEGYAVSAGAGSSSIQVTQTAGTFRKGEKISINGDETVSRTIEKVTTFGINDVYEFAQSGNSFTASKKLNQVIPVGFGAGQFKIAADGTVTSPRADSFLIFKPGDIFSYGAANDTAGASLNVPTRNVVLTVAADGQQMKVGTMTTVADVFDGGVKAFEGIGYRGVQDVSLQNSSLISRIPDIAVNNVDFSDSTLFLSSQVTNESSNALGQLVLPVTSVDLDDVTFVAFDQERYSVAYSNGTIQSITEDQIQITGSSITIFGLTPNQTNIRVNVTVQKSNIKNKVKEFKRCQQTEITRSVNRRSGTNPGTSINDGLNHSALYGIRVQDREICLNHPDATDVIAVLESLDTNTPVLDKLTFTSTDDIFTEAIIGEKITGSDSKAIARVISIDSGNNQISIVYLTDNKFTLLETLDFEESSATATVQATTPGKYNDITSSYLLDKGQKDQYYDYSKIVRNAGAFVPHRKLLIIYNRYDVPSGDTGDIFTVNSYYLERYKDDIPAIGP